MTEKKKCDKCDGCGAIANDENGTPWKFWEQLPQQSKVAVVFGIVRPIVCPDCLGDGER